MLKGNRPVLEVISTELNDVTQFVLQDLAQNLNVLPGRLIVGRVRLGRNEVVPPMDEALEGGIERESGNIGDDTGIAVENL